ncbi:MAG: DUF1989 domain-containing protein [Dermatophilaceae bacterium]
MIDPEHPQPVHDLSPARRYDGDGDAPAPGWTRIPPQSGLLVELAPGQALEVVDPLGEQVSDLYLVSSEDVEECFSAGRTVDYNNTLYVSVGGRLWSNRSRVMATIVADTVGVHDMTLTPCSQDTFDILYPEFEGAEHPSCFANLCAALEPVGVSRDRIGTTLNVFMDVWTDRAGELHIDPPPTTPGDRFAIRAEIPLFVGVTACSAEKSNNGHCTPIDVRVTT